MYFFLENNRKILSFISFIDKYWLITSFLGGSCLLKLKYVLKMRSEYALEKYLEMFHISMCMHVSLGPPGKHDQA